MAEEQLSEEALLDIAYDQDIPIVATNNAHFIDSGMYAAHDALLCIADGTYVEEQDRRRLTPEHRLKLASEMQELFADLPEAIENTMVIAKRCAYATKLIAPILPNFTDGQDVSEADMLGTMAEEGLKGRLEMHVYAEGDDEATRAEKAKPYFERLKYELGIINEMGFPGYFLIVADFIQWAKDHTIPVGPGRGSGAGSVVAWSLLITDLDPLRFGLLFERFLNPERVSMPDFDIDFCQDKRDRVIKYVQEKYGYDQVAQIITFGKLQARAVLRDVGRVMQQPYPVTDRLTKLVPNNPASPTTLAEAIREEPRLRQERDNDPQTKQVIAHALKLEGLYRHASTHAAGVVIGDRPLDQLVPLYRDPRSDMPVTQFNMKWVEKAGLVKFDFLGLKTLTVLARAVEFIAERDIKIDLETIPLDDPATFELLMRGDTAGVFQLESSGMRSVLKQLKPDAFEDIIAIVALYRPGPMDNIPTYIARKHGLEDVDCLHESLEGILQETYGVMIYQEQVMQIAQTLAGYSLGDADLLRRAMGKKIQAEMDDQRERFCTGASEKGIDKRLSSSIFDQVAKFAGYGFNKSHAAAYALIAYQTAYLKANYPVEFMAATMALDIHNTEKLAAFKKELQNLGVTLLPPDVNASEASFSVETDPDGVVVEDDPRQGLAVRYALGAIKNVGEKAMEAIADERRNNGPYKDLYDFAERLDVKLFNKRQMEQLIAAGALDGLEESRARSTEAVETLMGHAHTAQNARESSQESLFATSGEGATRPKLPDAIIWTQADLLKRENAAIGFYMSAHPLEIYEGFLERQSVVPANRLHEHINKTVRMAGVVESFQQRRSQKGKPYGFLAMSDNTGGFEMIVFSDGLDMARAAVESGGALLVSVSVERRDEGGDPRLMLRSAQSLDALAANEPANMKIIIRDERPIEPLKNLLDEHKGGRATISFNVLLEGGGREVLVQLPSRYKITPILKGAVKTCPGIVDVRDG